jgi:hypothetical protein
MRFKGISNFFSAPFRDMEGLSMTVIYVSPRCNCQTMLIEFLSVDIHKSIHRCLTPASMLRPFATFSYDRYPDDFVQIFQSKTADSSVPSCCCTAMEDW